MILSYQEIMMSFMGCKKFLSINSCFSTMVADLLNDPNPKTMVECKQCSDWIKWKEAIETELDSLRKRIGI
jgi:hypothetical protein